MAYGDEQEQDFGMGGGGLGGIGPDTRAGPDLAPGYDASSQMADVLDAAAATVGAGEGGVSMGADYSGLMGADASEGGSGFELANQGLNQAVAGSTAASNVTQNPAEVVEQQMANMSNQPSLEEMQSLMENAGLTGMSTQPQDVIDSGEDPVGLTPGEEVNQFITEAQGGQSVSEKLDQLNQTASNLQAGTGFSTAAGQGGFTGGSRMFDMPMDPTFANTGGWGVPQTTVNMLTGGQEPTLTQRMQALVQQQQAENDQLEAKIAALQAQTAATTSWTGGFNPQLDSHPADWENVTQGMNPQAIPDYSSPLSPEGALTAARPEFSSPFSPEGALTADQIGPTSPFTSPLSPEGAITGPVNPYDIARNASLAFDEYEIPSRQQQQVRRDIAEDDYMGTEDPAMLPDSGIEVSVSAAIEALKQQGVNMNSQDFQTVAQKITLEDSEDVVAAAIEETTKQSSKLTKAQKKVNMDKVRARWQARVDYAKDLKAEYEKALAEHGRWSRITADASRKYGRYVRSDEYVRANGRLNPSMITGIATGGATKIGNKIQDIFHSWGKTDPRSPEQIAQDLLDGYNSYTKTDYGGDADAGGPGTVDWMRSNYPWAKNLPDEVLRNAIKYPDYLRLILNAVADGKDIPLTVPDYILNPVINTTTNTATDTTTTTATDTTNYLNHPALQTRPSRWTKPSWMT